MVKIDANTLLEAPLQLYKGGGCREEFGEDNCNPNDWFEKNFPSAVYDFGPGFFQTSVSIGPFGYKHSIIDINEDAWARALGGEPELAVRVVYNRRVDKFFFFDFTLNAYTHAPEDRLQLLLSNWLVLCAQKCTPRDDALPLVTTFRSENRLKSIILKAKTVLEEGEEFFFGPNAKTFHGLSAEQNSQPSYILFTASMLFKCSNGQITLSDAYCSYTAFCRESNLPIIARRQFKGLIRDAVQNKFQLGLRNDIRGGNGRGQQGWKGIDCSLKGKNLPDALPISPNLPNYPSRIKQSTLVVQS